MTTSGRSFLRSQAPVRIHSSFIEAFDAQTVSALDLRRHMTPGPSCTHPAENRIEMTSGDNSDAT